MGTLTDPIGRAVRKLRVPLAWRRFLSTCLLTTMLSAGSASAQVTGAGAALELQVKAAYLFKFASYVDWPASAFASGAEPIVIGLFGSKALAAEVERTVEGRSSRGRAFVVRRLAPSDTLSGIHILFVGGSARDGAPALGNVHGRPILTVCDSPYSASPACMVTLVREDEKLRFEVALKPVGESGLKLSALMLTAARRVSDNRP